MEIKYSERAVRQIRRIWKGDKKSAALIMESVEAYAGNPTGRFDIKILRGKHEDLKRLRVGKYRIIFEDSGEEMLIYEIKHRQEAYHD